MKLIKDKARKYYKYIPWTQPVATSDTTAITGGNMVITASSYYSQSGEYPWKGFNGEYSGTSWCLDLQSTGWWKIQFPYRINVTGLKFYQRNSASSYRTTTARFYTSADKTIPIGDAFNPPATDYGSVVVDNIPSSGVYTDTIYLDITEGVTGAGMGMLDITASTIEESTSSDYDFYKDIDIYETVKDTVRKYYKYQSWIQPILTNDTSYGTITSSITTWNDSPVWQISDGIKGTNNKCGGYSGSCDIIWHLQEQIKINSFQVYQTNETDYLNRFPQSIKLYASDNGIDYTEVGSASGYSQPTSASYITVTCNTSKVYEYYKWEFGTSWKGSEIAISEIVITAQKTISGTSSDYDFYEAVDVYKAVKF